VKFGCPILAAFLFLRLGWGSNDPLYSNKRTALIPQLQIRISEGAGAFRPLKNSQIKRAFRPGLNKPKIATTVALNQIFRKI
jgi:hypothetical protein